MNWFKNLKISIKLIICFLVITSFTFAVGALGLTSIRQIDENVEYVVGQSRSLFYLAKTGETLQSARISVRDIVLGAVAEDTNQIERAFDNIVTKMAYIENYLNSFNEINQDADIQSAVESGRALYENRLIPIILGIYNSSLSGDLYAVLYLLEECVVVSEMIIAYFDRGMEMGVIYAEQISSEARDLVTNASRLIIAGLAVAIFISLLLAFYISSVLNHSIKALMRLAEGMSLGDLRPGLISLPNDEIGRLSRLLADSLTVIKTYVDEITALLKQIANKNFDLEIQRDYIGDFGSIKESILTMTDSMGSLVTDMQGTADGIDIGAGRVAASMQELMASFDSQMQTMDNMKNAVYRLNEKTHENVKATTNANSLSEKMQSVAVAGRKQMEELTGTMEEIKNVSIETAKIAKVVEDIALQTNILALNAAVEASRAGEHGRGFGVVAEEVRNLANRSAESAKETSAMLEKSQAGINKGEIMTSQTSQTLSDIVEITVSVAQLISEVAAASEEQAQDIDKSKNDAEEIFQMIMEDTYVAKENVNETEALSAYASKLNVALKQFTTKYSQKNLKKLN